MSKGIRVSRSAHDWAMVIRALELIGFSESLIARIRTDIQPGGGQVTVTAWEKEAEQLLHAAEVADRGRPSHFPPVTVEQLEAE